MGDRFDVLCMGELIVDFTCCGRSGNGYPVYEQNPGGGAANVAVSVARLGGRAAFLGKLGGDEICSALREALEKEQVDLSALVCDRESKIFLAFVTNSREGERSFSFYGDHPADLELKPWEINPEIIDNAVILSYGGRSISTPEILKTTLTAAETGRKAGVRIAFDPNIRLPLWPDAGTARRSTLEHIPCCDYLKLSVEEVNFLFGEIPAEEVAEEILSMGVSLLAVTDGPRGAAVYTKDYTIRHSGYQVKAIDTTGAGDSFWGSMLFQLAGVPAKVPEKAGMEKILAYACACGAITTTRQGAVPGMPYPGEVREIEEFGTCTF